MKDRYQALDASGTRLPCNDMKVADTVVCKDYVAHCTGPDDKITLAIQGAGDIFYLDQKCSDFFAADEDWVKLQSLLIQDVNAFNEQFQEPTTGKQKEFKISEVTLRNKFGTLVTSTGVFDFTYSIGWKFSSKEPRCFAGDYLKISNPTCDLQCGSSQCLLESLKEPNKEKRRMLQADNMAGPDVSPPSYVSSQLPLAIPSKKLNLEEYNVPERLLQIFLSNYRGGNDSERRVNLISGDAEEGTAEPINLSASFYQDIGPSYSYTVQDKAELESVPPAYIKITKAPKYGDIVVK